jgi:hypothetical protein
MKSKETRFCIVFAVLFLLTSILFLKYPAATKALRTESPIGLMPLAVHKKLIVWADVNALAGSQNSAEDQNLRALIRYSIALILLPLDDYTEPRQRAYWNALSNTTSLF